jgi:hypothetical protein
MRTDFLDSHQRHWDDAEQLYGASRWANADHLYGMAVECGLKRLMIAFGMPIATDGGPVQQSDRVHADQAWDRYETYRSGHVAGARYALPANNPFLDWHISQRYAHQNNFDQARATGHRTGAEAVYKLVIKALVEGLL